jgi:hypothetical protein
MKDTDNWAVILETVDALFCSVADGIPSGTDMSLEAAHEEIWTLFEGGYFKLVGTDDNVGIVPCHSNDERRIAAEQNKRLADYRRRVIEEARLQADSSPPMERPTAGDGPASKSISSASGGQITNIGAQ